MGKIEVINHPLIQHKLSILRRTETLLRRPFRELVDEIAMLMGYEVLRDLPLEDVEIETPIHKNRSKANRRWKNWRLSQFFVQGLGW